MDSIKEFKAELQRTKGKGDICLISVENQRLFVFYFIQDVFPMTPPETYNDVFYVLVSAQVLVC